MLVIVDVCCTCGVSLQAEKLFDALLLRGKMQDRLDPWKNEAFVRYFSLRNRLFCAMMKASMVVALMGKSML
jgi:hypothetical protein